MTWIDRTGAGPNRLFLREEQLDRGLELLLLAERCLTAEIGKHLAGRGLTPTAHRALYFVARHPGLAVGELLDLLNASKPNLTRVLKPLFGRGLIEQRPGVDDRRRRLLHATSEGRALLAELARGHRRRLAQAYRAAGAEAVGGSMAVLRGLVDARLRRYLPEDAET